jgi:molecular chaperone DnaJ
MKNFYNILGVNENATQDDIKKAYRKLAVEHHPDKGGDEEIFKEISEAFDTLGDQSKRQDYDNQRTNPFTNNSGGFNPFGDFFSGMYRQRKRSVPDKIVKVNVGAVESYLGVDKTISYTIKDKCNSCDGKGGERVTCTSCNGEGFTIIRMGSGLFTQIVRQVCNSCNGVGYTLKNKCGTCHGNTTIEKPETIKIKIPSGVDNGQFLKVQGKGDYSNGYYGNLVLQINMVSENNFEKDGENLIYHAIFGVNDLTRETYEVPHPSGNLSIKLPKTFDTSKPLRVRGKGYGGVGDLYLNLVVKFDRN